MNTLARITGRSYWIENGVAAPVSPQARAA
jgi:hypothetical protein